MISLSTCGLPTYRLFTDNVMYISKSVIKGLSLLFFHDNKEGDGISNCCCHHAEQVDQQKESRVILEGFFT